MAPRFAPSNAADGHRVRQSLPYYRENGWEPVVLAVRPEEVEAPVDPTNPHAPTIVLTERTDILGFGPLSVDFWVCGRFEVRDGRICGWRDYFSTADMTRGVARGIIRMVTGRGR